MEIFGKPREDESALESRYADLAFALQYRLENIVCTLAQWLNKQTGSRNFCLAGGVAMNCVLNGRLAEKEFVDMHTIHPDVLPEFDGNVAAKKTAEAIKKNPKVSPTPNPNPNAGDKNKVKSTEAPAANAGVVGESYMDKYAKYIRGDK